MLDPDGGTVLSVEGHTDVDARSDDRAPARTHLVLPLENVVFPVPGRYRVRMRIRGRELDGPSLYVLRQEQHE